MKPLFKIFLSRVLIIAMVLGFMLQPKFALMAYANTSDRNVVGLGTGAIGNPVEPESTDSAWNGSYVYYGKYDGTNPTKYRVLDRASADFGVNGQSLLLDCDSILYESKFGGSGITQWASSDVLSQLNTNTFLHKSGNLTAIEHGAIASCTKAAESENDGNGGMSLKYVSLNGEKIFVLDAKELTRSTYGYSNTSEKAENRKKTGGEDDQQWWLRSFCKGYMGDDKVGYVGDDGDLATIYPYSIRLGVSPAFNIKLSSVIFSTLISGTAGQAGAEYKLTLEDNDMSASVTEDSKATRKGNEVTVPYTVNGSNAENADQISVVVTDGTWSEGSGWSKGAVLKQYSKLTISENSLTDTGTGMFTMDDGITGIWGEDYHVYILAEDVKGEKETDYAGAPVEIVDVEVLSTPDPITDPDPQTVSDPNVIINPDPQTVSDPNAVNNGEMTTHIFSASAKYKGETLTATVSACYLDKVTYTGKKMVPKDDLKMKLDLSPVIKAIGGDSALMAKADDIISVSYTQKNCVNANSGAVKKATIYPKLKLSKAGKSLLTKEQKAKLNKLIKAFNKAAKKDKITYTINPLSLKTCKVQVVVKKTKDGKLNAKNGKLKGVKKVTALREGDVKPLKLKKKMFSIQVVDAEKGIVKVEGLKNFCDDAEVVAE